MSIQMVLEAERWLNEDESRTVSLVLSDNRRATAVRYVADAHVEYVVAINPITPEVTRLITVASILEIVYNVAEAREL
jgi:hypothetical protein